MTRALLSTAFAAAALMAASVAHPVAAQQPRLVQSGDGYSVEYDGGAERGNVAGGRAGSLTGGGENASVLYSGQDMGPEGRFAVLSGGGESAALSYVEPNAAAAPAHGMAGKARASAAGTRG